MEEVDFSPEIRRVSLYELGAVKLSTVFLVIDHNHFVSISSEPILFETMLFIGNSDIYMTRYTTYEKAKKGHEKYLKEKVKGELLPLIRKKKSWRRFKKAIDKSWGYDISNSARAGFSKLTHELVKTRHF